MTRRAVVKFERVPPTLVSVHSSSDRCETVHRIGMVQKPCSDLLADDLESWLRNRGIKHLYGHDEKDLRPGLYLGLCNGYWTEEQFMRKTGWGASGPCVGPLAHFHIAYNTEVELEFAQDAWIDPRLIELIDESPVQFSGSFLRAFGALWGDWVVFTVSALSDRST